MKFDIEGGFPTSWRASNRSHKHAWIHRFTVNVGAKRVESQVVNHLKEAQDPPDIVPPPSLWCPDASLQPHSQLQGVAASSGWRHAMLLAGAMHCRRNAPAACHSESGLSIIASHYPHEQWKQRIIPLDLFFKVPVLQKSGQISKNHAWWRDLMRETMINYGKKCTSPCSLFTGKLYLQIWRTRALRRTLEGCSYTARRKTKTPARVVICMYVVCSG